MFDWIEILRLGIKLIWVIFGDIVEMEGDRSMGEENVRENYGI